MEVEVNTIADGRFFASMHWFDGDVIVIGGSSVAQVGQQLFVAIGHSPGIGRVAKLANFAIRRLIGIVRPAKRKMN